MKFYIFVYIVVNALHCSYKVWGLIGLNRSAVKLAAGWTVKS